jgi:hypothetical protein
VRVLELIDISGEEPVVLEDSATLDQNGKVTYKGTRVKNIIGKFFDGHRPDEVFDKMADWSNGYVQLQERGTS